MVELDLPALNSRAPYALEKYIKPGSYSFVTDYGVKVVIMFLPDYCLVSDETYQFIISNANNKPSPRDIKLRNTILELLLEFFRLNNHTVLYFCDTGDGRQILRDRLFKGWVEWANKRGGFAMVHAIVCDEEGRDNFVTLISRNDNPRLGEVVQEFKDYVESISKPFDSI